ncbi:MAG: Mut7-C RNAse domain-containing protein [Verrucomicrobiota bacterium]|nr:Mut7-C RNAse domain-containing protein [Limisphaera sp.]MDW8381986.1 Mut7-C RNAse domain-containing protein [Verrucomicrobiota bacterium]
MRRILKACQRRFEILARQFGSRRPAQAVAIWMKQAWQLSQRERLSLAEALVQVDARLQARYRRYLGRRGEHWPPVGNAPLLFCDAGLGGLARWLWAAGQEAIWSRAQDDRQLVEQALQAGAVLLTTDTLLLERRVIRTGRLRALWIPPTLEVIEQLALVFTQLELKLATPRCMRCGGRLEQVPKATVADRIPPRTARWLDEYFLCSVCGNLFWQGTHWQQILNRLRTLGSTGLNDA